MSKLIYKATDIIMDITITRTIGMLLPIQMIMKLMQLMLLQLQIIHLPVMDPLLQILLNMRKLTLFSIYHAGAVEPVQNWVFKSLMSP